MTPIITVTELLMLCEDERIQLKSTNNCRRQLLIPITTSNNFIYFLESLKQKKLLTVSNYTTDALYISPRFYAVT